VPPNQREEKRVAKSCSAFWNYSSLPAKHGPKPQLFRWTILRIGKVFFCFAEGS
jgi:hypothetical protein